MRALHMSHVHWGLGLGHFSNNCRTAQNTYLFRKALTSFFFGILTVSLRLSSRAICSLRSSPRLRRSSCRGQWNLKLVVNVMTSLYRTKQSWPEAGNSRLYYVLFQRRIQKQFIRLSLTPCPTHLVWLPPALGSHQGDWGTDTTKLRKGNTYSKIFFLKMKMAL